MGCFHTFHQGFCLVSNGICDLPNPARFSIGWTPLKVTDSLGLCNISPINEWLYSVGNRRLVKVLRVKGRNRAEVAIVQLIEVSSLDNGHRYRGILR